MVIVTGAGRGFCAGFDLDHAASAPDEDTIGETCAWTRRQEAFAGIVTRLRSLPQPVIAAVNGPANGAGFGMALAAEIRIAARSARFNAAFLKVGMSGCDIGVSWLLPRHVGLSRAFELLLTGRMIDAEEADRIGLVSAVVDDADLLPRALEMRPRHCRQQRLRRVDDQARGVGQYRDRQPAGGDRAREPNADALAHDGRVRRRSGGIQGAIGRAILSRETSMILTDDQNGTAGDRATFRP